MSGGLVEVGVVDGELVIRPRRLWKLWSFCRVKRIPQQAILDARVSQDPAQEIRPRWRAPGLGTLTSLAGYLRGPTGRSWWCYRYGQSAVVLEVNLPKLDHVVFIADDNAATVAALHKEVLNAVTEIALSDDILDPSGHGTGLKVDWANGLVDDPAQVEWHGFGVASGPNDHIAPA